MANSPAKNYICIKNRIINLTAKTPQHTPLALLLLPQHTISVIIISTTNTLRTCHLHHIHCYWHNTPSLPQSLAQHIISTTITGTTHRLHHLHCYWHNTPSLSQITDTTPSLSHNHWHNTLSPTITGTTHHLYHHHYCQKLHYQNTPSPQPITPKCTPICTPWIILAEINATQPSVYT